MKKLLTPSIWSLNSSSSSSRSGPTWMESSASSSVSSSRTTSLPPKLGQLGFFMMLACSRICLNSFRPNPSTLCQPRAPSLATNFSVCSRARPQRLNLMFFGVLIRCLESWMKYFPTKNQYKQKSSNLFGSIPAAFWYSPSRNISTSRRFTGILVPTSDQKFPLWKQTDR